jgi:hypothetical protein
MLVGSSAAKIWFPEFREPKDIDYFYPGEKDDGETFWHERLADVASGRWVAFPDELYTIKVSHIFWDLRNNSWGKHFNDILFFQSKGCKLVPSFYEDLYPIWEERYGKKAGNLNVPANMFFNDNVTRKYEHDSIHASVAYGESPLFEQILRDGSDVAVDRSKFDQLPYEDKLNLVREEVYATALERYLIPADYKMSPKLAYHNALKKTITSFWKGDWALFIALNALELKSPDVNYLERHLNNRDRLVEL